MTKTNPIPFNPDTMQVRDLKSAADTLRALFDILIQEEEGKIDEAQRDERIFAQLWHSFHARTRSQT